MTTTCSSWLSARSLGSLLFLFLLSIGTVVRAQSDSAMISTSMRPGTPADLVIANRTIITLRAEVFADPPAQRTVGILTRLDDALSQGGKGVLRDSSLFGGRAILLDDRPILFIAPLDLDPTMGETMETVTERTIERLGVAISESREVRDSSAMLWNIIYLVLYSALFILVLFLLGRLRGRLTRKAEDLVKRSIDRAGLQDKGSHPSSTISILARRMGSLIMGLLMLVAFYFWLTGVLNRIPVTRVWSEEMFHGVEWLVLWAINGFLSALPGLAMVTVILLITRWVTGVVSAMFIRIQRGELEVSWIDAAIAAPTRRVAVLLMWLFAIIIAYPYIPGSSSKAFQGVSVLAGLMLSLGSSGVVGQASSGLVVMFNRLVRVGECVAIGDLVTGVVKQVGYFNTVLVTSYGENVTVPNSTMLSSKVINYSRTAAGVLWTTGVTIGYDSPWRQVHQMLLEAARLTPNIAVDPPPAVAQHALNDFYVDYRLTFVVQGPFRPTLTALHANIQDIFNANGVQIMSPHYEADPAKDKVVPPEQRDPGIK